MVDPINLQDYAESCISDALYDVTEYDRDALRDAVQEQVHEAADNACIYTHNCYQIISDYERDVGDVDDLGGTYTAEQWQEAMTAYAYSVASAYLHQQTAELLSKIEDAADNLEAALPADVEIDAPKVSTDCPHGWAVHDREDANGIHYWSPGHLEGCSAIAVKAAGIWLSYTWTPSAAPVGEDA